MCVTSGYKASSYNETLQPNNQLPFTGHRVRSRQQQMMMYNLMEGMKGKVGRGARSMKRVQALVKYSEDNGALSST